MKIRIYLIAAILVLSVGLHAQETNQKDADGNRHGLWTGIYEDTHNIRYEGIFDHGKETGVFNFYDNVAKKTLMATREFNYDKNSVYIIFYDHKMNKVSEGKVFISSKEYDGEWKYYHKESRKIMTLENYVDGKLQGVRTVFYPNGKLAEETHYNKGIKNGIYKKYTEKGTVLEKSNFKDGKYEGEAVYSNSRGVVLMRGEFKNGKKSGIWKSFEKGKLAKEENMDEVKKSVKAKTN